VIEEETTKMYLFFACIWLPSSEMSLNDFIISN